MTRTGIGKTGIFILAAIVAAVIGLAAILGVIPGLKSSITGTFDSLISNWLVGGG